MDLKKRRTAIEFQMAQINLNKRQSYHTSFDVAEKSKTTQRSGVVLSPQVLDMSKLRELHCVAIGTNSEADVTLIADEALFILLDEIHTPSGIVEESETALDIINAHLLGLALLSQEMRGSNDVTGVAQV